jgi:hypothetical protein
MRKCAGYFIAISQGHENAHVYSLPGLLWRLSITGRISHVAVYPYKPGIGVARFPLWL